ncbi:MAG TPA: hypothetical protein VGR00_15320, partial [Thermoanaerobaculia bacterium]|nr:hypothetical protein [Thermoanaerobaculia bacterium]
MASAKSPARPSASAKLAAAAEFGRSTDPFVRRRALEVAATLGASAADLLWNGLLDPDPVVREPAIQLAGAKLPPGRLLEGVASEGNSVLRTACIEALKIKGAPALPALKKGIHSKDEDVVLFSLQILGSMPEKESVPLLVPFLS